MIYKLKDICIKVTDGSHFSPKAQEEGYPMFSVKDMLEYGFNYTSCKRISKQDFEKMQSSGCVPQEGDVLVAKDGSYLKEIFVCTETKNEAILSSIAIFRPNQEIVNPYYLCYLLKSPQIYNYIASNCVSGSALPRIVLKDFKEVEMQVPDMSTQTKIVNILKNIDGKIQNNYKINRNLSEQAQAVFNSWFVKYEPFDEPMKETPTGFEAPESFEYVQIDSLEHVLETGRRPKGGAVSEGIPSVGAESVKGIGTFNTSSAKYIPVDFAAKQKTGKVNGYELMIYKDGGKPGEFHPNFSMFGEGYPFDEFFINEHVFKLDFGDRGYNEFAYFWFQTDYVMHWLESNGGKAAIPGINQTVVNSIWILSPDSPKVKEYCEWIQPLFTQILKNCYSNLRLAELRDTLLPKLMSGELDVSDLNV